MRDRTKTIEINDERFEIRRFSPEVGSFILMKMLGAAFKGEEQQPQAEPQQPVEMPDPEQGVRALVFAAWLRGLDFETHKWVMQQCLAVCCRLEMHGEKESPIPIGKCDDPELSLKLEMEALVFNISPFLAQGTLSALQGSKPKA